MSDHQVEIVLVIYQRDFENTVKMIRHLRQQQYLYKDIVIRVVVNDTEPNIAKFKQLATGLDIQIHTAYEFGVRPELHAKSGEGWVTQQYLKLAISQAINSPWYLIIDGDQGLWNLTHPVSEKDWFVAGRAYCKTTSIQEYQETGSPLLSHFEGSADLLGVDLAQIECILNETPPMMMHTGTVKKLLQEVDSSEILKGNNTEFSLYWLYLVKNNLDKTLYEPLPHGYTDQIHYITAYN
jgi:hypothetical protein